MAKRIMVVDDDKEFLDEFCDVLRSQGYETAALDCTAKFFRAACEFRPDLIVLDLRMPGKNGFELATGLGYFAELCRLPVIAMSGSVGNEYDPTINICNFKACFRKPFEPVQAVDRIAQILKDAPSS